MAKRINITKNLLPCNSSDLPQNFMAAAVWMDENKHPVHAGIFLRYHGQNKFFHYPGANTIELEEEHFDIDGWYFHKKLVIIDERLIPSILTHCEIVKKEAKPKYGFYYMGEMYDEKGDLITHLNHKQFMTCVGFCLSFIKYCLAGKDFLSYEDWDFSTVEETLRKEYLDNFFNKVKRVSPDIKINDFKKGMRRILPIEYLTGAFSQELPVPKSYTDEYAPKVKAHLKKLVA